MTTPITKPKSLKTQTTTSIKNIPFPKELHQIHTTKLHPPLKKEHTHNPVTPNSNQLPPSHNPNNSDNISRNVSKQSKSNSAVGKYKKILIF